MVGGAFSAVSGDSFILPKIYDLVGGAFSAVSGDSLFLPKIYDLVGGAFSAVSGDSLFLPKIYDLVGGALVLALILNFQTLFIILIFYYSILYLKSYHIIICIFPYYRQEF
ncbi:hypothetical protein [Clostridium algidicarnis]|uniref:Uncharacterized protein n=1 Tax=Clostridium algidicarnis TaxID=37659 RepID=A0ABS6C6N1_9CLOT|nr:hypothetical protein [Clostridium algidicarnis]MBU3221047.1 hypothetical protein [Clostridium algidicarnis]